MSFDVRTRISKLKSSAKARGLNINLDLDKYQNYIDQGCFFCGNDLTNEKGYCLDRVDHNKGYSINNVVPCCKTCNYAKGTLNIWEFAFWIEKAYNHTIPKINSLRERNRHNTRPTTFAESKLIEQSQKSKERGYKLGRLKVVNTDNDD